MVSLSNNGGFGANQQLNEPAPAPVKQPRVHECGNVVNEVTGVCPQCYGQLTESTALPILLD